ncbi:hypothetical protein GCM10027456_69150 [Kineosporia babensis]
MAMTRYQATRSDGRNRARPTNADTTPPQAPTRNNQNATDGQKAAATPTADNTVRGRTIGNGTTADAPDANLIPIDSATEQPTQERTVTLTPFGETSSLERRRRRLR